MGKKRGRAGVLNEVLEVLTARHSVRAFRPDPVPAGDVNLMLEAAVRAPSAGNRQPWFFVAVESRRVREGLARAAGQTFVASAPVCLVVCAEPERSAGVYGERGRRLYCYQDTAAATQNILLAATSLGLGACWVGAFDEDAVSRLLELPACFRPVALVPVGYPAGKQSCHCSRRDLAAVARFLR